MNYYELLSQFVIIMEINLFLKLIFMSEFTKQVKIIIIMEIDLFLKLNFMI